MGIITIRNPWEYYPRLRSGASRWKPAPVRTRTGDKKRSHDSCGVSPPEDRADTLVLDSTREGRHRLTDAIRLALPRDGALGDEAVTATVLERRGLTRAEAARATSYTPGDLVAFRRRSKRHGIGIGIGIGYRIAEVDEKAVRLIDPKGVAVTGFNMLRGYISTRDGVRVILGCFILFGAPMIARGLMLSLLSAGVPKLRPQRKPRSPKRRSFRCRRHRSTLLTLIPVRRQANNRRIFDLTN
jgi:hypothetical protein